MILGELVARGLVPYLDNEDGVDELTDIPYDPIVQTGNDTAAMVSAVIRSLQPSARGTPTG